MKKNTIELYVERYFEENDTSKVWDCVHELCRTFCISTIEAYRYVSVFLSKNWLKENK